MISLFPRFFSELGDIRRGSSIVQLWVLLESAHADPHVTWHRELKCVSIFYKFHPVLETFGLANVRKNVLKVIFAKIISVKAVFYFGS